MTANAMVSVYVRLTLPGGEFTTMSNSAMVELPEPPGEPTATLEVSMVGGVRMETSITTSPLLPAMLAREVVAVLTACGKYITGGNHCTLAGGHAGVCRVGDCGHRNPDTLRVCTRPQDHRGGHFNTQVKEGWDR